MASDRIVLVGIDGGATEVKAHAVSCDDLNSPGGLALRPESATQRYPGLSSFTPVPIEQQLAQRDEGRLRLTVEEVEHGRLWVRATAEAVEDVARQCRTRRVLLGVGMPGLKTADGGGICVINNGPRMPAYLDALKRDLTELGIELVAPLARLGSDGDYCGLGEEHAADGLLRDVENAYYLGCGTGIAEALKLRGRLVPFDQAAPWILKAWQMPTALGPTFENLVSVDAMNRVYARLRPHEAVATTHRNDIPYPEVGAASGEPLAQAWMSVAALVLAELIFERLWTIKNGRADCPHRGVEYGALQPNHEYRGVLLDRVVVGQRGGAIYAKPATRGVFAENVERHLAALVRICGDEQLSTRYLAGGSDELASGFVQPSRLRAAPALGAAVAAARAFAGHRT